MRLLKFVAFLIGIGIARSIPLPPRSINTAVSVQEVPDGQNAVNTLATGIKETANHPLGITEKNMASHINKWISPGSLINEALIADNQIQRPPTAGPSSISELPQRLDTVLRLSTTSLKTHLTHAEAESMPPPKDSGRRSGLGGIASAPSQSGINPNALASLLSGNSPGLGGLGALGNLFGY
jgi:hypothetical protein